MDPITQQGLAGSAGAGGDPVYVDDVFSTFLYEGNSSQRTIANGIDLSGEGGLVWIKNRGVSGGWGIHYLFDTERSPTNSSNKYYLRSDSTASQAASTTDSTKDFGGWASNGFLLGSSLGLGTQAVNGSSNNYVSWTFRKAPGFFDVVTFTGTGSVQNISHSLGSVPGMIIVKKTSGTGAWNVYHRSSGANGVIYLHGTHGNSVDNGVWNNTAPTSSVFTVGADVGVNANGSTYVAYVFAHDDQSFGTDSDKAIIKCGSFVIGSGATSDVDLGFEPQFVLTKLSSTTGNWLLSDVMRGTADTEYNYLQANASSAESTLTGGNFYTTSTGFHYESLGSAGNTVVYMAIRRPHKPPTAGTEVFTAAYWNGGNSPAFDSNNHVVDFGIYRRHTDNETWYTTNRLTAPKYLQLSSLSSEYNSLILYDYQYGFASSGGTNYLAYMFARAPGFFDVVTYTGTGSTQNINHNLEGAPEMIIVKNRVSTYSWTVYHSSTGATKYLRIQNAILATTGSGAWNDTAPTSSVFTVGSDGNTNQSGHDFVAYLFASLDGISKVGSYTGTGSNINVDCGFTSGARFVLIKRTDATGDWYVWDSTRGIVSGNDPYTLINSSVPQVTNTDYIDPLNSGFTVTSSAPATLNASGGTYLFLAIA